MVFAINKCRITLQIAAALASFLLITAQSIDWDPTCGTTKGCFPECTTGCEYLVTWYTSGSVTYFDLKAEESNPNVSLAIGFSKDRRMGDDSVIGCIVPGNNTVQVYYNEGTKSKELPTVRGLKIKDRLGPFVWYCSDSRVVLRYTLHCLAMVPRLNDGFQGLHEKIETPQRFDINLAELVFESPASYFRRCMHDDEVYLPGALWSWGQSHRHRNINTKVPPTTTSISHRLPWEKGQRRLHMGMTFIQTPEVSHTGGVITCAFIRDVKNVDNTDTYFDLNNDYYLMLVVGDVKETDGGSYKLDKHKKIPWMSDSVVDFNSNKTYGLYKLNSPVVKLHGIMMTLVWMLLVIVGMVTARYNREMFPGQKLCGEDVWFQVHRAVMVTALVFAFVGFIPIFVEIEGYSQILEGNVGVKAHPVLGIIVTVLLCINPSMAFVRPGHNHKFRWIFNWVHRAVGAVAQILAITTVFIGFRLERAMLSNTIIYVTIDHLVIVIIICVVLEIHKWISDPENRQQSSLLTLPFILLLILSVVALIFELAILGLIAAS